MIAAVVAAAAALHYPPTRTEPVKDVHFGIEVKDPYRWLEDGKAPEVQAWMKAQDELARAQLSKLPGRDALRARYEELFYLDAIGVPVHRGGLFFYTRRHKDREKAILYVREGENGAERALIDPNTLTKDGTTSLGTWSPSYDGKRLAYVLHPNNSDEGVLHVLEVASGKPSDLDVIDGANYTGISWTPAGDGFYFTRMPTDPKIPQPQRMAFADARFHKVGTDPKSDLVVHEKTGNPELFLGVSVSRDGRWLICSVEHGSAGSQTDVYLRDLRDASPAWKTVVEGVPARFGVSAWKDRLFILTNEGAPHYKVLGAPAATPSRASWKELVAESKDAVLQDSGIVGGRLALSYTRNVVSELEVRDLDGKPVRRVALPALGTATAIAGDEDVDDGYFLFQNFTTPPEIYRTSLESGETSLWARVKVPVDPKPYEVEQVWYPSKDGTRVSMFVVHKKGLRKDGSTPFLLYGYGGFNISLDAVFKGSIFPWLEAGGGYAMPNLRGGGEYGEDWHKAGMLARKQNVFDDFIGAAGYLVKSGYTRPERLAIRGESNGGLLVGAALTQRPDLFHAVVCGVPLLDMVRYHLFGLGRAWISEYGSADDEAQFKTLFAYSPYHHVKAGTHYPAVLMMSADADDRVDPLHARKLAAALQAASKGGPVLLRIEQHSGHGGADMVRQAVAQNADAYAFLIDQLGLKAAGGPAKGAAAKGPKSKP